MFLLRVHYYEEIGNIVGLLEVLHQHMAYPRDNSKSDCVNNAHGRAGF